MEDVGNQDGFQKDPSTNGKSSPTITYDEKQILNDLDEVKLKQELLDDHFSISSMLSDEKVNSHTKQEESCEHHPIKVENDRKHNEEDQELKESSYQYSSKLPSLGLACLNQDRDAVVRLATEEGGLVDDNIRRMAWPILLGYRSSYLKGEEIDEKSVMDDQKVPQEVGWHHLPRHRDEDQVQLDVNRSFVYYPTDMTPTQSDSRKSDLSDLITEVLRRHPMLCYFQGFHDICQVVLLVLGSKQAVLATEYISLTRIRDFMLPSITPAVAHLHLLLPILNAVDPTLCAHISAIQPYFALSSTLTLYAHDITVYSDVARLFDVFLGEDPTFPLYFFVSIVISRRDELLDIPSDEPDVLHVVLSRLPKPLRLEVLISQALKLREDHPPEELSIWRKISNNSVLKTFKSDGVSVRSQDRDQDHILREAERHFEKQCSELTRAELKLKIWSFLRRNRRPILSILVGVSAIAFGVYYSTK